MVSLVLSGIVLCQFLRTFVLSLKKQHQLQTFTGLRHDTAAYFLSSRSAVFKDVFDSIVQTRAKTRTVTLKRPV